MWSGGPEHSHWLTMPPEPPHFLFLAVAAPKPWRMRPPKGRVQSDTVARRVPPRRGDVQQWPGQCPERRRLRWRCGFGDRFDSWKRFVVGGHTSDKTRLFFGFFPARYELGDAGGFVETSQCLIEPGGGEPHRMPDITTLRLVMYPRLSPRSRARPCLLSPHRSRSTCGRLGSRSRMRSA